MSPFTAPPALANQFRDNRAMMKRGHDLSATDIRSCISVGLHAMALSDLAKFLGYGPGAIKMQQTKPHIDISVVLKPA